MIDFLKNKIVFIKKRPLRFNKSHYHIQTGYPDECELVAKGVINEGLIKTYPYMDTGRTISDMFWPYIDGLSYDPNNCHFTVMFNNNDDLCDEIIQKFDRLGWYCSVKDCKSKKGKTILAIEPKFQKDVDTNENDINAPYYQKLYHVTPECNKEKILKMGLCPKSKNMMFDYPGRVYGFPSTIDYDTLMHAICLLWSKQKRRDEIKKYSLFSIDRSKLQNVSFEPDLNGFVKSKDGDKIPSLYTTDNIPPTAITHMMDFDIDKLISVFGLENIDSKMNFKNSLKK